MRTFDQFFKLIFSTNMFFVGTCSEELHPSQRIKASMVKDCEKVTEERKAHLLEDAFQVLTEIKSTLHLMLKHCNKSGFSRLFKSPDIQLRSSLMLSSTETLLFAWKRLSE